MKSYLNVGCGRRYIQSWTNIDLYSASPDVLPHDLTRPLPFPDATFDLVYHSHVLEHFARQDGERLIQECVRVLRPEGILRVVVPDLQRIARAYLEALTHAQAGEPGWDQNYEWSVLMLYDQAVRSRPGGQMLEYLRRPDVPNRAYVLEQCGSEMARLMEDARVAREKESPGGILQTLKRWCSRPNRRKWAQSLFGRPYLAQRLGKFRLAGEIHQWMYDPHSLGCLLAAAGLSRIVQQTATTSYVPDWSAFHLDTDVDGQAYKPESLFMEGKAIGFEP